MRSHFFPQSRRFPGAASGGTPEARVLNFPVEPARTAPASGNQLIGEDTSPRNALLAALPASELARLEPHLQWVRLGLRQAVLEPNAPIRDVYFPATATVSLVDTSHSGQGVEVGSVGCEGFVGLSCFLGDERSAVRAVAQVPGVAGRMSVEAFTHFARESDALRRLLLRYTQAVLMQLSQAAVCNGAHLVEERCARWLLTTQDRVGRDELPVTHDTLARMLGVRAGGVTVALHALQDARIICLRRDSVKIIERRKLEEAACACYRLLREQLARLLAPQS